MNYISIDVETDGPCPGLNSMLQLGAAAFNEQGELLDKYSVNLLPLNDCCADQKTTVWWNSQPEAYANVLRNQQQPSIHIPKFVKWVERFERPTAIAYPAGFDFPWIYYYCYRFNEKSPFGFQCLDIKSYAAAILKVPYREATKKNMPKAWFAGLPRHTHDACDDAIEQGMLFFRMLAER